MAIPIYRVLSMFLTVEESVFSIPFRFLWSPNLGGELEALNQRPCGIDRFVGDDSNRLLSALFDDTSSPAALALQPHNWPLVFYGAHGTGKTSLALALLTEIVSTDKFIALSGADFDRRFRSALATDALDEFRNRILQSHCLLIDGVQQLADKIAVQQELIQIMDRLTADQKPVWMTLDQVPQLSPGLVPQLVSRLIGGLSIPLKEPGKAARAVIIEDFCQLHRIRLSRDSISLLTDRLNWCVPKIAHFFAQLKTALRVEPKAQDSEIDPSFIYRLCQPPADDQERITNTIVQTVAKEFKFKPTELSSESRKQSLVFARNVAVYLLRKLLGLSFLKIGAVFGNRDHSTIMHGYRKIELLLNEKSNSGKLAAERNRIQELQQRLNSALAGEIDFVGACESPL